MTKEQIVLESDGTSGMPKFSLAYGEGLHVFASRREGDGVKFVANNREELHCRKEPVWVECVRRYTNDDISLINNNIDEFRRYGLLTYVKGRVGKEDMYCLESGEVRLLNTIMSRLRGVDFIEINTAGLCHDSIRKLLDYILRDINHNKVAYIIVTYRDDMAGACAPIQICEESIPKVIDLIERVPQSNRQDAKVRKQSNTILHTFRKLFWRGGK